MEVEKIVYNEFKDKFIADTNVLPPNLMTLINNIIIKEGYKSYEVEHKSICTKGGNYLGDLFEIDVKGVTKDGAKETNIFVKNIVSNEDNLKILSIPNVYKTEMFAYKELYKVFNELQDEYAIPVQERYKMVKSFDECNLEAIILENVARRGYKTPHRMDVISLNYAELAIQQLAKFHALSFAIKLKRPMFFNEKIKTIKVPQIFSEDWQSFMKSMCKLTLDCLDDEMRCKMENIFPTLLENYPRYMLDNSNVNCLCHGDFRSNNIMMKEANGVVVDLIPIDYQLMYYGSPANDFLYFIYNCTDKAMRKQHFQHLKDLYYSTVERFLEYFHVNATNVYPKTEFEKILKETLDLGLIIVIIYGPFIFVDEDDVPDLVKDSMANVSFKIDDKYKDRLRETIEEFIEWGYIQA